MGLDETKVHYLSKQAPAVSVRLGGTRFTAVSGVLSLPEDKAEILDKRIASGDFPALSQAFQRIDLIEAQVAENKMRKAQLPQAQRGAFTSQNDAQFQMRINNVKASPEFLLLTPEQQEEHLKSIEESFGKGVEILDGGEAAGTSEAAKSGLGGLFGKKD